jgi:hypothetical protein
MKVGRARVLSWPLLTTLDPATCADARPVRLARTGRASPEDGWVRPDHGEAFLSGQKRRNAPWGSAPGTALLLCNNSVGKLSGILVRGRRVSKLFHTLRLELDKVAAELHPTKAATEATQKVGDVISSVAPQYADEVLGIGFGSCGDFQQGSKGGRKLYIHRTGGKKAGYGTQFLFDQCWLVAHCTGEEDEKSLFIETGEPTNGYVINCELAVESEWGRSPDAISFDFLKIILCKAKHKLFVFSHSADDLDDVFARLRSHLLSIEGGLSDESYLIACLREDLGRFTFRSFNGDR